MKFYLSSYHLGNKSNMLRKMMGKNKRIAYIPNASDAYEDKKRVEGGNKRNMAMLRRIGLQPELLDLRDYFSKGKELEKKLREFGGVWVRGGNTFVLRQAMKLSGFDEILKDKLLGRRDFVYGGYSAGICILAPTLRGLEIVDDPSKKAYKGSKVIWDGLGILDYMIIPHYKSKHKESRLAGKTVKYFIEKKMLFKALRDKEVLIFEKNSTCSENQ